MSIDNNTEVKALLPRTQVVSFQETGAVRSRGFWKRLFSSPQVILGTVLLTISLLITIVGPFVAPFDPTKSVGSPFQAPGDGMLLGGDQIGRDVFSRVLWGGVYLVWMAPLATVLGVGVGATIGLLAAYYGGRADSWLMRIMDVLLAFPGIVLALLIVSVGGSSPLVLTAVAALILVPGVARVIRGAATPLNRREHVLWAKAIGQPARKILLAEYLPNVVSPLMVEFGVRLMWCIGILATLSFLGNGIEPPTADWGLMVSENRNGMTTQPLAVISPIVMIVVFTVGGNLIAEGIARVVGRTEGKN